MWIRIRSGSVLREDSWIQKPIRLEDGDLEPAGKKIIDTFFASKICNITFHSKNLSQWKHYCYHNWRVGIRIRTYPHFWRPLIDSDPDPNKAQFGSRIEIRIISCADPHLRRRLLSKQKNWRKGNKVLQWIYGEIVNHCKTVTPPIVYKNWSFQNFDKQNCSTCSSLRKECVWDSNPAFFNTYSTAEKFFSLDVFNLTKANFLQGN